MEFIQLDVPTDCVLVHGLFVDAMKWDDETMKITDSIPGEMNPHLPVMHMEPKQNFTPDPTDYNAPMYKTGAHAGVLATTGHSTNFVIAVRPSLKTTGFQLELLCALSVEWTFAATDNNTT